MNEHDNIDEDNFPEVTRRLRRFGQTPLDAGIAGRALARTRAGNAPRIPTLRLKWLVAAAVAGFAAGGVGLAAADVLPAPVQDAAHTVLNGVGVHVPPGHDRYNDPNVCVGGPYKNHGAYVRAHKSDPNAGKSPCGKPTHAITGSDGKNNGKNDTKHGHSSDGTHGPSAHSKAQSGHANPPTTDNAHPAVPPPPPAASTSTTSTTSTTLPEATTTTQP